MARGSGGGDDGVSCYVHGCTYTGPHIGTACAYYRCAICAAVMIPEYPVRMDGAVRCGQGPHVTVVEGSAQQVLGTQCTFP